MHRILLVDNYDSFTFNLHHYLIGEGAKVDVVRNDEIDFSTVSNYHGIVLSPGSGLPQEAGKMNELLAQCSGKIPILGVCLGMQAIAEFLGGKLVNQKNVKHGVQTSINVFSGILFKGIISPTKVGLYHSWCVDDSGNYLVNATSEDQVIMAIENTENKLFGIQFHPESILTPDGRKILSNFIQML